MAVYFDPRFGKALDVLFANEGGFVHNPADPGGATNMGLTIPTLRAAAAHLGIALDLDHDGDIDADDVRLLTRDLAAEVYYGEWWSRCGYGQINDEALASKVFNQAVLMGPRQAHLCLQRAINELGGAVGEDGALGPKTHAAINAIDPNQLLAAFQGKCAEFYRALVAKRAELSVFQRGWLNRCYA